MSIPDFGNGPPLPSISNDTQEPMSMTKSAFESLGIVMDNGTPRFRLDEPVTSHGGISLKSLHFQQEQHDPEDNSFVVLGKSSMDFVNTASLADYEQIKEHSLAVDTSIVSTLSHEEIEKKVVVLLQENQKLKETLAQNNNTMKNHFNTLASYQEALRKVHDSHKQKFAETRDMITILKEENAQLKMKLAMEVSNSSKFSGEMIGESIMAAQQKPPDPASQPPEKSTTTPNDSISSQGSSHASSKFSLVAQNQPSNITTDSATLSKLSDEKKQLERNLHYQQEIINSLKDQIRALTDNSFPPVDLGDCQTSSENSDDKNRKQFLENFTHYNSKLATLAKCYTAQMSGFTEIQDCLKSCIDILDFYENFEPSDLTLETRLTHKQKLDDCRKELVAKQLTNISERQNLIKAQKQFEKIFSDYNSALHELEILREEYSKPVERKTSLEPGKLDILREKKVLEDARKLLEEEKQRFSEEKRQFEAEKEVVNQQKVLHDAFEGEKTLFSQEKERFEEQKELLKQTLALKDSFEEEKVRFEVEKRAFLEEKARFEEEKDLLNDEKASLNSQGVLYEAQLLSLQENAKIMEKNQEEFEKKVSKLKQDLESKDTELEGVRARLAIAKEDKVENELLKHQLGIYKDDFEEEQKARQELLRQREELTDQLGKLREYNQQLLQRLNGPNTANQQRTSPEGIPVDCFCDTCGLYKMPGQWHGPGFCQPVD